MMITILRYEFKYILELSSVDIEQNVLKKLNLTGG